MVYDTAKRLAEELRSSDEYRAYTEAKARAMESSTTRALIEEYGSCRSARRRRSSRGIRTASWSKSSRRSGSCCSSTRTLPPT